MKTSFSISEGDLAEAVDAAAQRLQGVAARTPLQPSLRLSERYGANILLKREDLQQVRSFKIRGAYNKISSLTDAERARGVVCASAGNHAQGLAYACAALGIGGVVFMPATTPNQKVERVKHFGGDRVEIRLVGDTYDEAGEAAEAYCAERDAVFVHPFDDPLTIAGQGTIARELLEELGDRLDLVVTPVGGGGLASGIASYLAARGHAARVIGAEPAGGASMQAALHHGGVVSLQDLDPFVDGASVRRVGALTYELCRRHLDRVVTVPEGRIATALVELYQDDGIITEPAGALSVSALDDLRDVVAGKTVVCILSGGNNDLLRYPEILERSLVYQGRKHYFIVEFAQKPGQLRRFVDEALGPTDDIVRFEYIKKTNKEKGAALIGIELRDSADLQPLLSRMDEIQLPWRRLASDELLYDYLI